MSMIIKRKFKLIMVALKNTLTSQAISELLLFRTLSHLVAKKIASEDTKALFGCNRPESVYKAYIFSVSGFVGTAS